MAIYDRNGKELYRAYVKDGARVDEAYDRHGNIVFPTEYRVRVMSYNAGSWYGYAKTVPSASADYYYALHDIILKQNDVDLLGTQEYYNAIGSYSIPTWLGGLFQSVYAVNRTSNPTKAGRALASRYALSNTAEINFQTQSGEVRSFLTSTFQINGKTVYFINTHLALINDIIAGQIDELLDYVSDKEYWILVGDFNVRFDTMDSDGYDMLIKPFVDEGYHSAQASRWGIIPTWNSGDGTEWHAIDNIFTSGNIDILDVFVDTLKTQVVLGNGVDHIPLIADLQIN